MRRILLALLICLLPLQSFAGLVMSTKMAGMASSMSMAMSTTDAAQAPCHEASQPDAAASHDCCGLQGVCHGLCQVLAALPAAAGWRGTAMGQHFALPLGAAFQSADLCAGFKPPLI